MHFFHSFWKNLHLTENFYTDMSVVSVTNMRYAPELLFCDSDDGEVDDEVVKDGFTPTLAETLCTAPQVVEHPCCRLDVSNFKH